VARRIVALKSRWSTPEATAREFGLSPTELDQIVHAARKLLATYKGPLPEGARAARKLVHHSRRRARSR
jgi:hypothetical protein